MTDKELFGKLCMDALIRYYENETGYASEDSSCSPSHAGKMQEILGKISKIRISGKRLVLLIAAVLLTAAILGGTVMSFYDRFAIRFQDMRDILQDKQTETIETPTYPSFDGFKMAEMYFGTELRALQKNTTELQTIEIGVYRNPVILNFFYHNEMVSVKCQYDRELSDTDAFFMETGGYFWYRNEMNDKIQFEMRDGTVHYTVTAESEKTAVSFIKENFKK